VLGERELDKNTMNRGIIVEATELVKQLRLSD
jgi:hypothetical protein